MIAYAQRSEVSKLELGNVTIGAVYQLENEEGIRKHWPGWFNIYSLY